LLAQGDFIFERGLGMNNENKAQARMKPGLGALAAAAGIALAAIAGALALCQAHCRRDWNIEGTYSGSIPCADCPGIRETLTLDGGKYAIKTEYGAGGAILEYQGEYNVQKDGIIELENYTRGPNKFQIAGSDALLHLDEDGRPPESEFNYVLIKRK
jgi:uncharacterized lipoprotein NlpE involved in copper resistance